MIEENIKIKKAGVDDSANLAEILFQDQEIKEELKAMITDCNAHYFQRQDTLIWFAYHSDTPIGML